MFLKAIRSAGEFALQVLFGKEETHRVALVQRDTKNRDYWHVLCENGRRLIFRAVQREVMSMGADFRIFNLKRGDEITIRIHGKGVWDPFGRLDEDPFGSQKE